MSENMFTFETYFCRCGGCGGRGWHADRTICNRCGGSGNEKRIDEHMSLKTAVRKFLDAVRPH